MKLRVHVTGASGAGVTTLGRALADALAAPHHDTDDYFWLPTEPPYRLQRPVSDRLRLMHELFVPRAAWVLSGSVGSWARELEVCFDRVVYVSAPTEIRLARLRHREDLRNRKRPPDDVDGRRQATEEFFAWAASYDDPAFSGRSRAHHEAWLGTLRCPVAQLDGTRPTQELVASLLSAWQAS
ncbi:MAG: hypothetical protein KDJ36_05335 [Hyphomicrobiaceae bacterium]|nr:hypothetical protein [Hyphomicrobiaceae bacterium]